MTAEDCTSLVAIDTTIVSVAIPKISTQFDALDDVGWTVYKLFNAKFVYLSAIAVFEAGSALSAAAPKSPVFILGRGITGSGAALLIQGAISIITHIAKLKDRPLYIGFVVSCFGISASFSPVLGGALTSQASWRWCFWINLPIGALVFLLVLMGLKLRLERDPLSNLPATEKMKHLDPLGIILLLGACSCLFLALQWGGSSYPWSSSRVIGLMVGFGLLIISFGGLQTQLAEKATLPPRILRKRTVSFGTLALFFISMSSNMKLYYLPFYFQAARGGSALRSGVEFLALAIPQVVATIMAGGLATKTGHYFPLMLSGAIVCSVGTGLLVMIGTQTPKVTWVVFMIIAGFGDGMCTNMPYTAIQAIIDDHQDVFIGNAIATFATLAGGAIGISIGENVLVSQLLREVPRHASGIPPKSVIASGALDLQSLTTSLSVLHGLRQAYALSISAIMIAATVAICISVVATLGMQRVNLVEISRSREVAEGAAQIEIGGNVVDEGRKRDQNVSLVDPKEEISETSV